ncbi:response regulator [Pelagicoccus sp. SDUM812003]|uniref:response regulator n=1 Tax=Pelagicoccus sp. SDUM812003 TaxID=3041267 RepID=UPI00280CAFE9|nr:response regulator [Pelagicoccus sp. SDUM812003]MDQ8203872.1 response regulator [Pelagicoccus sp. SDUM812003]
MSRTIITVDDSPSIRQMVSLALMQAGHKVLEAADGQEALDVLQRSQAQMVITDLNMPRMDGISLIKRLRALPAYKYVPIVMLTTESQQEKKMAGKSAGATGWIVKPFTSDQLLGVVKKVLR